MRVAGLLVDALPGDALLVVGSSNPVRDLSPAGGPAWGRHRCSPTGVSPGSTGPCRPRSAPPSRIRDPAYALLGDLTLLHDTTGFVIGPAEPRPDLTVVVLNDSGGGLVRPARTGCARSTLGRSSGCSARRTPSTWAALAAATGLARCRLDDLSTHLGARTARGIRLVEIRADRARTPRRPRRGPRRRRRCPVG